MLDRSRGVEEVWSVVVTVRSACVEGAVEAGDWRPAVAAVGGVGIVAAGEGSEGAGVAAAGIGPG